MTFEQNTQQEAIWKNVFQEQVRKVPRLQGRNMLGMLPNTRQNNSRGVIRGWAVRGACLLRMESYESQR